MQTKTYSPKPADITRKWYVVDASETTLGRLSTAIASLLLGKRKPQFSHHIDCGDYVVVINAQKAKATGDKEVSKLYHRHSGYPGSLKTTNLGAQRLANPESIIEMAVKRMLPDNKLRADRLKRLKVYPGSEHDNAAQKPEELSVKDGV